MPASEITAHLIGLGHRRIGYIKGDPNQTASARRFEGYVRRLARGRHRAGAHASCRAATSPIAPASRPAEKLLARRPSPTAIIASNDDMAAACISVAHRRGLDVPRDLSVVGFDDTSAATTVWPELTTIRQPIAAMADSAIDILLRQYPRQGRRTPGDGRSRGRSCPGQARFGSGAGRTAREPQHAPSAAGTGSAGFRSAPACR